MTTRKNLEVRPGEEILEKAYEKAVANGWKRPDTYTQFTAPLIIGDVRSGWERNGILMDIPFAKALWGEQEKQDAPMGGTSSFKGFGDSVFEIKTKQGWQYHLQQMVIADDPIQYLGRNI